MSRVSQFVIVLLALVLAVRPVWAQDEDIYTDPAGLFSFAIPEGWADESTDAYAHLVSQDGEGGAHIYVLAVEANEVQEGIQTALALTDEEFSAAPLQTTEAPLATGVWTQNTYVLADSGDVVAALGQVRGEVTYVMALRGPQSAVIPANETFLALLQGIEMSVEPDQYEGEVYEDPAGLFSVPVPTNWTLTEAEGYGMLSDPEDKMTVWVLAMEGDDVEAVIADAWLVVDPGFDLPYRDDEDAVQDIDPALVNPKLEKILAVTYQFDEEADNPVIHQGMGMLYEGVTYLLLFKVEVVAAQQRAAQLSIIQTGFDIKAMEKVDLTGVEPLPVDDAIVAELEAYIVARMPDFDIPGAAVAIVQNGAVVYAKGFGVRDRETGEPVTPETQMLIGSTTKTMTTLLMAQLVDDGVMTWDTHVVDILPSFAVKDPEITEKITVQNLVCACTGVPRRDFELVFNGDELSAEDIVASLADFEFFTDFGEAFQYSNQMVATGGYIAALAAGGEYGDLYDAYLKLMDERVFDPIGMTSTTFSFEEVEAGDNYASAYGLNLFGGFVPLPLEVEESFLRPIAPAGGAWSNVLDLARYVITELNEGVTPDETRIVSAENLRHTWEPQVAMSADASYGLGWIVDKYKGLQILHHGGNTLGYTTDLAFIPSADLGVVVLTNGRITNTFNEGVRNRLFELVFDQEIEYDSGIQAYLDLQAESQDELGEIKPVDAETAEPYLGVWSSDVLGEMVITLDDDGVLWVDVGEIISELRARVDDEGETTILTVDPPLAGLNVEIEEDENGNSVLVIGGGVNEYTFEKVE
ncbi:MAG: beta-lactamase family protein [Anaerolineae bacterium]|nr:beta-lactamase family protein [Anaerolineae bacterium]